MKYIVELELFIAGLVRYLLIHSSYWEVISNRVEIATILNSWKRVTEGVALYQANINPYTGGLFHETPLTLVFFSHFLRLFPSYVDLLFVLCDLLTGLVLYYTTRLYMKETKEKQEQEISDYNPSAHKLILNDQDFNLAPIYVLSAFLFNPFIILNCVGFTTTTYGNLFLALVYFGMISGRTLLACTCLALATIQSLYPVILLIPLAIYIAQKDKTTKFKLSSALNVIRTFIFITCLLLQLCYYIINDWTFADSIYAVILTVPDLRPNIGLFWYFFTEMFEHFRSLFIYSFQLNATLLYLIPLSLRFHTNPMLLATSLTAITSVFKSYPSLGDVGFYLSLMPMWRHLFNNMQQGFIIGVSIIVTSVLGPIVWHLWIYTCSANANFYFGVTLAFATAQIFLITDLLFSYIKREFSIRHGIIDTTAEQNVKLLLE